MRRNAVLLFVAVTAVASAFGAAAPPTAYAGVPAQAPRSVAPSASVSASAMTFTLVTGDVARLTTAPNGSHTWQLLPAAGTPNPAFQHFTISGDDYVLPYSERRTRESA